MQEFKNSTLAIFQRGPEWLIGFQKKFWGGSIKQILRMDKKYTGKVLLWLQFTFFNKIFWDFWGFLKFRDLVAKSEIGT